MGPLGQVQRLLHVDPGLELIEDRLAAADAHGGCLSVPKDAAVDGVTLDAEQLRIAVERVACFGRLVERAKRVSARVAQHPQRVQKPSTSVTSL